MKKVKINGLPYIDENAGLYEVFCGLSRIGYEDWPDPVDYSIEVFRDHLLLRFDPFFGIVFYFPVFPERHEIYLEYQGKFYRFHASGWQHRGSYRSDDDIANELWKKLWVKISNEMDEIVDYVSHRIKSYEGDESSVDSGGFWSRIMNWLKIN